MIPRRPRHSVLPPAPPQAPAAKVLTGDCRNLMPEHGPFDMILADPPYGDTSLGWDRRVDGWLPHARAALRHSGSLWVFGSLRSFDAPTRRRPMVFQYPQGYKWNLPHRRRTRRPRAVRRDDVLKVMTFSLRVGEEMLESAVATSDVEQVMRRLTHAYDLPGCEGSVTLNGTSLTVNEVEDPKPGGNAKGTRFGVNIIPHTQAVTTWGKAKAGDPINLEIDMLARYVARLVQKD